MPWTRPTLETIYQRVKGNMEGRVTEGVKIPGISLLGLTTIIFSEAAYLMYGFIERMQNQFFLDTATSWGRQRWANILGIQRIAAVYTEGTVTFNGTVGYEIAAGTILVNDDGLEYVTLTEYIIGTSAPVTVRAEEAGTAYNTTVTYLTLGETNENVGSIVPIQSGFDNGVDLETSANWIQRMIDRLSNPPASGNAADYIRWAKESSGEITNAWVIKSYAGGGTVGVVVADDAKQAVSSSALTVATTYIDSVKPAPALVYVLNATNVVVSFVIGLTPNNTQTRAAVVSALQQLFLEESEAGEKMLLSYFHTAISSAYPDDYRLLDIKVDDVSIGLEDVTTVAPQVAVYGSTTFMTL